MCFNLLPRLHNTGLDTDIYRLIHSKNVTYLELAGLEAHNVFSVCLLVRPCNSVEQCGLYACPAYPSTPNTPSYIVTYIVVYALTEPLQLLKVGRPVDKLSPEKPRLAPMRSAIGNVQQSVRNSKVNKTLNVYDEPLPNINMLNILFLCLTVAQLYLGEPCKVQRECSRHLKFRWKGQTKSKHIKTACGTEVLWLPRILWLLVQKHW